MSTIKLFPISVYKTSFGKDVSNLIAPIQDRIDHWLNETKHNNQGSMRQSGLCSYNVKRDMHTWPELKEIVEFIEFHSHEYWKTIGYKHSMKPGVYEMWANRYPPGSFIDYHNHSPIHMTATFVLQAEKNSGNIIFENPLQTLLKHQPYEVNAENFYHLFESGLESDVGDLIIFPGYLNHKTLPNNSKSDRIILGANVCNVI